MTQTLKDQLAKVLDTPEMCKKHHYSVKAVRRHPDISPNSMLAWEIHLHPEQKYISALDDIIGDVLNIDKSILFSLDAFNDPYIELF